MTPNVGGFDRIARIVVGLALIAFAVLAPATISWKWVGYIGVVPLLTALVGFCPAYTLLGLNTCPMKK
jgi:fatty acid desaturase